MLTALRVLPASLLLGAILTGCALDPQPTSGEGWRLVDVRSGNVGPGIDAQPIGDDAYLVEITVLGPGGNDCGHPRFIGFEPQSGILIARIVRSATTETCLVTSNTIFDVLLERRFIPVDATQMELSEPCSGDAPGCPGAGVPIIGPGGSPPPVPTGSFPGVTTPP